eukprot:scaffold2282_cov77-Skeletonema_dohrnii-CCMP3373.AAC.9
MGQRRKLTTEVQGSYASQLKFKEVKPLSHLYTIHVPCPCPQSPRSSVLRGVGAGSAAYRSKSTLALARRHVPKPRCRWQHKQGLDSSAKLLMCGIEESIDWQYSQVKIYAFFIYSFVATATLFGFGSAK